MTTVPEPSDIPEYSNPVVYGDTVADVMHKDMINVLHISRKGRYNSPEYPGLKLLEHANEQIQKGLAEAGLPNEQIFTQPWGIRQPFIWRITQHTMWHQLNRRVDE